MCGQVLVWGIGADFGDRAARGSWSKYGRKLVEDRAGGPVLDDVHGTSIFECEPRALFTRVGPVTGLVSVQTERLMNAVTVAVEQRAVMSDRDQLAYDLHSASFSGFLTALRNRSGLGVTRGGRLELATATGPGWRC